MMELTTEVSASTSKQSFPLKLVLQMYMRLRGNHHRDCNAYDFLDLELLVSWLEPEAPTEILPNLAWFESHWQIDRIAFICKTNPEIVFKLMREIYYG